MDVAVEERGRGGRNVPAQEEQGSRFTVMGVRSIWHLDESSTSPDR